MSTVTKAPTEPWIKSRSVLLLVIALRIFNAWSIRTFFQPDEYFQSLEPAWQVAFGNDSKAWITWEWKEQLRSSIHPYIFSTLYKSHSWLYDQLGFSNTVTAESLVLAPKDLQAVLAAAMDYFTYILAGRIHGSGSLPQYAALALTIFSPWQWFCSTRTLSNCLESTLTVGALALLPWYWFLKSENTSSHTTTTDEQRSSRGNLETERFPDQLKDSADDYRLKTTLTAAALACVLRPTNALIWLAISVTLISRCHDWNKVSTFILSGVWCGSSVLAASIAMDWNHYGFLTLPPVKFVYFNIVQSLAVFYGTNRPDYYFTEGLPLLLTTALPFAIIGLWTALKTSPASSSSQDTYKRSIRFSLATSVVVMVLVLSLIAHKEVRFVYPLLPILHVLAAEPLATIIASPASRRRRVATSLLMILALLVNAVIATYVTRYHQCGVVDVMHYLRHRHETLNPTLRHWSQVDGLTVNHTTVGFFMPCHSTPWRSHLVYPSIDAWALTCEPPINVPLSERKKYVDEADQFYASPETWIVTYMRDVIEITPGTNGERSNALNEERQRDLRRTWPQLLVFFEQLEPILAEALNKTAYKESWRGFNTHWHDDWRRQGDVVVWELDLSLFPE